jgi:hypothetical protein
MTGADCSGALVKNHPPGRSPPPSASKTGASARGQTDDRDETPVFARQVAVLLRASRGQFDLH